MEEEILRIFAASAARYFTEAVHAPASLGTPYLGDIDATENICEFSAVIGITGNRRGNVYLTAPRALLEKLLRQIGEATPDDRLCADLVGEMANTIAGNVREQLGAGFMISVPVSFTGQPSKVHFSRTAACYVLPILWGEQRAYLWIALQAGEDAA